MTTWFGGGTLDLRNAKLDPAGATIKTSTLFGGGNLIVPDDWRVETALVGIGGAGDGRPSGNPPAGAPTLRLEGARPVRRLGRDLGAARRGAAGRLASGRDRGRVRRVAAAARGRSSPATITLPWAAELAPVHRLVRRDHQVGARVAVDRVHRDARP